MALQNHYPSSDLWKGEQKIMAKLAGGVPEGGTVVEIGTWQGGTTRLLYETLHQRGVNIYTVDIAPQSAAYQNLADTTVKMVVQSSTSAAQKWDAGPIDLLFIDGSHLFEDIFLDYNAWVGHLRPGGLVIIHDYDAPFRGGVVHLGVQVLVDTLYHYHILDNPAHEYRLFYGNVTNPAGAKIEAGQCSETFSRLASDILKLQQTDYEGWTVVADDKFTLLLEKSLQVMNCPVIWPPQDISVADLFYLVSAHPQQLTVEILRLRGVPLARMRIIDSLKACYLVEKSLETHYEDLYRMSSNKPEFVRLADMLFTLRYACDDSGFPRNFPKNTANGAPALSKQIAAEQLKINILSRILHTIVDWTP